MRIYYQEISTILGCYRLNRIVEFLENKIKSCQHGVAARLIWLEVIGAFLG
jgi:hypothetical protein